MLAQTQRIEFEPETGPVPTGPEPAIEAAIREHHGLVRRLARQVHRSASAAIDLEELVQTGLLALVQAARTFVPRGEAAFATYAAMRVRGAMIDLLRQSATLNRGAMRRRRKLKETEAAVERRLGRAPSMQEVADEMGLSVAEYRAEVDGSQPVYMEPLDSVYNDQTSLFASDAPNAEESMERDDIRTALAQAIARLPQREALVLQLYFVEELTLEEIGNALDVGAARICQIKKAALAKLRSKLDEMWE